MRRVHLDHGGDRRVMYMSAPRLQTATLQRPAHTATLQPHAGRGKQRVWMGGPFLCFRAATAHPRRPEHAPSDLGRRTWAALSNFK